MRHLSTIVAAAALASASFIAGPAGAAPLSGSLGLKQSAAAPVQMVQWRGHGGGGHWRSGRWIGPAAGFAAGAVIGSALAAPYSYDDYAYAPGYGGGAYGPGYEGYASGSESYGYADSGRGYMPRRSFSNTGRDPIRRFDDPAKGEND